MRIFSRSYKTKLEAVCTSLSITADGLFIGRDVKKEEIESVCALLGKNTLVFVPERMKDLLAGMGLVAVPYGNRLRFEEEGIFTDNLSPSIVFRYPDRDTAEEAYALCSAFNKPLSFLSDISFPSAERVIVHSEAEAIDAAKRLASHEKTLLYYEAPSYDNVRKLAEAFSVFDYLVMKEASGAEKMKKAAERCIFSPLARRLSQVFVFKDDGFCAKMYECEENLRTVEIVLEGESR